MRLKTLGGLALGPGGFHRPKTLLLLAYLAVEGAKDKRHIHELFWPEAADPANSLRSVGKVLRRVGPDLLRLEGHGVSTGLQSDIAALQAAVASQDAPRVAELYGGAFLAEFSLPDWGAELEEWVYSTREFVAGRARAAFIHKAEAEARSGAFDLARQWAERAYGLEPREPSPEDLERLYPLLLAGNSPLRAEVKKRAAEYELEFALSPRQAREKYFVAAPEGSPEPRSIPHNLSRAKTSFVGRDPELVELGQLLAGGEARLITLLGPGGIGKTRLALQLAANQLQESNFLEGVYFVALEALGEPSQIPLSLAQTLGIAAKDDPWAGVKAGIARKRLLLVLDNFEHLVEGALLVSELLGACPNLRVVVTSRERLNLEEEFVLRVEGLPLPEGDRLEPAEAGYNDALKLFVQRAKRARLEFQLDAESLPHALSICRFVGGSPLGIELAAVWLRSMPVADLAHEIHQLVEGLETPSRNMPERHQSLRGVFEHSWKLLRPGEQTTLARLAVFVNGFSREAASRIAGATIPLLTSLVDKSLLRVSASGRYDFHPLLHQFAAERLAESPRDQAHTRAKHAHYFQSLIEASQKAGQQAYVGSCKEEYQNLLAALAWLQESDQPLLSLRLGHLLAHFWALQGNLNEGRLRLTEVLSHPGAAQPSRERASVLLDATNYAFFASRQGDYALAQGYAEEALAISQALGLEELAANTLTILSLVAGERGDYDQSQRHADEALALARRLNDDKLVAHALVHSASVAAGRQDFAKGRRLAEEGLALFRKLGLQSQVATTLGNLGFHAWILGDLQAAKAHLEEAIWIALALPDLLTVCIARSNLSGVMLDLGNIASAQGLARQALEFRWEKNDRWGLAYSLENLANLAVLREDAAQASRLWGVAERLREEIEAPMPSYWQARQERFVAAGQGQLSPESFRAAWESGRATGLEEAVRYALAATEVTASSAQP